MDPHSSQFQSAFNVIEDWMQHELDTNEEYEFGSLLRRLERTQYEVRRHSAELKRLARLRKLIAHNHSRDKPLAVPTPLSVERVEAIAEALNVGVAAHVAAASAGGPRYDPSMSSDDRKGIGNGDWLCQSCAKLVDNDESRYTKELLLQWKQDAEWEALREIESASEATSPSDIDALKEYSAQFDRAALQVALRSCGSYKKFAEALGDLISLLNTGTVQGRTLTKRRADFDSPAWRKPLEALYHEVRGYGACTRRS